MSMEIRWTVLVVCLCFMVAPVSHAATVNVFAGAPDVFPNFSTISGAVNAAGAGDTVEITDSSTYDEEVNIGKNLTLRSVTGLATVRSSVVGLGSTLIVSSPASNVTFENLKVDAAAGIGVAVLTSSAVTIDNCDITNNGAALSPGFGSGIVVIDQFGPLGGDVTLNVIDSVVEANMEYGLLSLPNFVNGGSDSVIMNLSNTSFDRNGVNGLLSRAGGVNTLITATNCSFDTNDNMGIYLDFGGTAVLSLDTCQIADNGLGGIGSDGTGIVGSIEAVATTFSALSSTTAVDFPPGMLGDLDNCAFNGWGLAAINVRGSADVTLTDCSFTDNPDVTGDSVFRNLNYGAPGDSKITVTGGEIEYSLLLSMGNTPSPADGNNLTLSLDGVQLTATTSATSGIIWVATGDLTLNMANCDVTGIADDTQNFINERNISDVDGPLEQNVRLVGTIRHCTFIYLRRAAYFMGNRNSIFNIDQCDFVNLSATGGIDFGNSAPAVPNTKLDIVDTIFQEARLRIRSGAAPTVTINEDYNFIGTDAGFVGNATGTINSGGHTISNPFGPDYLSNTFGDPLYLALNNTSQAATFNSGNGPETYVGAKGTTGPPPSSVKHWNLFE